MRTLLFILIAALLGMLFSGCTVIGFSVGWSMDAKNEKTYHASWTETRSIPQDREVDVALTSGDTLRGTFAGLRALPADSYRSLYDRARIRLAADSALPPLGEIVFLVPWQGQPYSGEFRGFEAEALVIRRSGQDTLTYQLSSDIVRLRKYYGRNYNLERLCALASGRALPSRREFTIQTTSRTYGVPLQDIEQVYAQPRFTYHALAGAGVGLAVDAFVAAMMYLLVFPQGLNLNIGGF